ncbi:MAG: cytochrome P450 [Chloroflexota bacterium]
MRLPPGPPPVKGLMGQLRMFNQIKGNMIAYMGERFDQYGDFFMIEVGGGRMFMVSNPEAIYEILVQKNSQFYKGSDYRNRQSGLARFLGSGLLTSDGEFWKRQRKLTAPGLHARRIEAYAETMVDVTLRTMDGWRGRSELDVDQEMMHATLQIVAKSLFNVDMRGANADRIGAALTVLQHNMGGMTLIPAWVPTPNQIRIRRAIQALDEIVYGLITERRRSDEDYGDLLSMLLLARDDEDKGMSDLQVRDEAVTLLLAGHETTANALNWTFMLLAQNPDAEALLHEELDTVLGGRTPTLADLKQLPYTERVVKEALRLYPPAYSFGRMAIEDTVIAGYDVPAHTDINIFNFMTHRDPRWWDAPEAFRPERFSPENESSIPRYAYLPFGGGPRVCIGNSFAMMEARLMLATIAQRYQLRLTPGQKVELDPLITLRPLGGMHMRVEQREPIRNLEMA